MEQVKIFAGSVWCHKEKERRETMNDKKQLLGKNIYVFGDSIMYGHTHPEYSFMRQFADMSGINLHMCAVNGATVVYGDNCILHQIENAPNEKPDFILFDGYTNDAYDEVLQKIGEIKEHTNGGFDHQTFCGAFEEIVSTMQSKWKDVPIIYVTIHKSNARDWKIQCLLREKAIAICKAYNVQVLDIFLDSAFDTRVEGMSEKYIIDGAGSHPNEAACKKFYLPYVSEKIYSFFKAE